MPIYEYRCENCGHEHEKMQRMSEDPLKDCPNCNKPALKRLVSASRFQLKGKGWYVTDFRDKPKNEKSTDKAQAKPTESTTKDKPIDSKTAEKSTK